MIYAIYKEFENSTPEARLFFRWEDLHTKLFNPFSELLECIEFKTHGKTYEERKESARDIAKTFQGLDSDYSGAGLSWGEYATIGGYFETLAKQYGLTKEFHENAII